MSAKYCAILVALFTCKTLALDSHTNTCTSHCTLSDKNDAECWNQTLNFFEEALFEQLRGYVLSEIGVAAWKLNHKQEMDWTDAAAKTVKRMTNIRPPDIEDEKGITDQSVYEPIIQSLISDSKDIFDKNPHIEFVPPCTIGCEIEHETYKRLFIGSMIGSVVLFIMIVALSMYNYRRVKNAVRQEAVRAMQTYELNLNNKSKQTFKLIDVEI